ncbi:Pestheic acid cluster transcriptional regulator 3 [Hyphodiscus hymeniophilus]|uniref:Pestheic acid cluster transcriptional regulator 3 n=1 Tax=Hyphodiscus hymeniophilus TaxID=353542 RepID=A0A9P7AUY6_9HELO|nr:Pestheic acid cluster transcriptional regulator 3 [Hyphodiscus hymeniophilus]
MPSYVVVGASRGLGYEWLRQLSQDSKNIVIGLVREVKTTQTKLDADNVKNVTLFQGDMADAEGLRAAAAETAKITPSVDYLIVNGAYIPKSPPHLNPTDFTGKEDELKKEMHDSLDVNVLGVIFSINAFVPLVRKSSIKKIAVISTGMADTEFVVNGGVGGTVTYASLKAATNMVVAKYAVELKSDGIALLALSPGLVNTRETPPTEQEMQAFKGMMSAFQVIAPHFQGPIQPAESVVAQKKVIENLPFEQSGAFLSHWGNKEWLMVGPARSKGGCWTCKLRKKKCDESRPSCAACIDLGLDCHGYGPKPSWMDGGAAERDVLAQVRQKVKLTASQKRKSKPYEPQQAADNAPDQQGNRTAANPVKSAYFSSSDQPLHVLDQRLLSTSQRDSSANNPVVNYDSSEATPRFLERVPQESRLKEDEAGLLMHYIDFVFPQQFPFYRPTTADGGRGWLLSLLMQMDPLYYASLSIAAYHQHYEAYYGTKLESEMPACPRLDEQHRQYVLSLERLRHHLGGVANSQAESFLKDHIEVLACMVLLVSLEVFKGVGGSWQIHLKAASNLLPTIRAAYDADHTKLSDTHSMALIFFSRVLEWYSTLSGATTGTQSFIQTSGAFGGSACIPSHKLMGCEDWVLFGIMNITELGHWKDSMQAKKRLSVRDLAARAGRIEDLLENGLKKISTGADGILDHDLLSRESKFDKFCVTSVFVYAALIYLHVIVSGAYPDLPEIQSNVSLARDVFRRMEGSDLVRNLSWPLCIIGCMTNGDQEQFFRGIALSSNVGRFPFGSSAHVLNIMEECWRLRRSTDQAFEAVHWMNAMQSLNLNILLV